MAEASIEARARFDRIRYAQLWEDADVLHGVFNYQQGGRYLSICSAGDNALALLTLDPERVVAADLSEAQLECLRLRMAAIANCTHQEFLEVMGARPSQSRAQLFDRVTGSLGDISRQFWAENRGAAIEFGAANIGKFENYFRIFRSRLLPLIHPRATIEDVFTPRAYSERKGFFETRWNGWRWRLATSLFFSKFMMGRLGRDPAFFDHVEGSAADHVRRKVAYAAIEQDPSQNPYMRSILLGMQGTALPLAWRAENYAFIRARLDRLELFKGPIDQAPLSDITGFNLSDIFEYMSPRLMQEIYARLLRKAAPGSRLVYWNMMAPRQATGDIATKVVRLSALEDQLKSIDKAFFYRDLVIEEVLP